MIAQQKKFSTELNFHAYLNTAHYAVCIIMCTAAGVYTVYTGKKYHPKSVYECAYRMRSIYTYIWYINRYVYVYVDKINIIASNYEFNHCIRYIQTLFYFDSKNHLANSGLLEIWAYHPGILAYELQYNIINPFQIFKSSYFPGSRLNVTN